MLGNQSLASPLAVLNTKIIEVQDSEIGKGRRHCWTQCKFMGPFFDIAAFRSTFGARIFHERYIYLQYKDTE